MEQTPSSSDPKSSAVSAPSFPRPAPPPKAEPHRPADLRTALWQPLRTVDVVLASPERGAANVDEHSSLGTLALVFLLCAVAFTIPYGLVLGADSWWRLITLYLGSTLICLPSLYVFTSYVGVRVTLSQILVLALLIPAAAAVFTLGFAPILGFLRLSMSPEGGEIAWRSISKLLLGIALAAGILQLWRCLLGSRRDMVSPLLTLVFVVWHGVFLYVFVRMFRLLDL